MVTYSWYWRPTATTVDLQVLLATYNCYSQPTIATGDPTAATGDLQLQLLNYNCYWQRTTANGDLLLLLATYSCSW